MQESATVAVSTVKDVTIAQVAVASVLDPLQIERIGEDLYTLADDPMVRKIVVDMASVKHLSSGALGMLISVQRKCKATKSRMVICGLASELRKVFKLSNLDRMFTFEKDRGKALLSYGVYAS